jgi:Bacterial dnaA protein helix-turn-helix
MDGLATKPTVVEIQRVVCEAKLLSVSELKSAYRHRDLAYPRQVAMALSRELTDCSYPLIGRLFGDRDHTTVLFAVRKIAQQAARNPALAARMDDYRKRIAEVVAARPGQPTLPCQPQEPEPAQMWAPERPSRGRSRTYYPRRVDVIDKDAWLGLGGEREVPA